MSLRSTSHAADHRASGRGARSRPRALRCGCSSTDRRSIDAIGSLLTVTALEPLALPAVDGDWEEWLDARCGAALEPGTEERRVGKEVGCTVRYRWMPLTE